MSQGKDNHADLGNAETSTPQPGPNRKNIEENERDKPERAHGQMGAGFEDDADEYAHSDGAAYRQAGKPAPRKHPSRAAKSS